MSDYGYKIAILEAQKLPHYSSQEEAEQEWFGYRDKRIRKLNEIASASHTFEANGSPESLKHLESWYFKLWEDDSFESVSTTRQEFEECMAMYFGEVAVKFIDKVDWLVSESAFVKGRYQIGVGNEAMAMMISRFTDHYKTPNNKRRQYIWKQLKTLQMGAGAS